jgi:FlaA1/EpsC-like NDP-sugar epimerase
MLRLEVGLRTVEWSSVGRFALVATGLDVLVGFVLGLYRGRRRVGSLEEVVSIARHLLAVTVLAALADVHLLDRAIPLGAAIGAGLVTLVCVLGSRVVWRTLVAAGARGSGEGRRTIVFGGGDAGAHVITALLSEPDRKLEPVAILDDDPRRSRLSIRGVPVVGNRSCLQAAAERYRAQVLLIAIADRSSATVRELVLLATRAGLDVRVVPRASELYGDLGVDDIREVTREDLLGRQEVRTDLALIADAIADRTVLVTGAGGSIGTELCRQVKALGPRHLVMLDRDESALHATELLLNGRALLDERHLVVADIRDAARLHEVFAEWKPDIVFHAAALKHLPLLEMHPGEGMKTNVYGTLNVLRAAASTGVPRFVNISTDKAADPTSVLGYTKRIAERLTAWFSREHDGTYVSVRFGNVLGSRGSFLTAFRSQIRSGGPLTVTHPDVTRYFMTVEEAVSLVVRAGVLGRDGEALVLDMGDPVSICEVAERMISSSGRRVSIEFTGLRPGEKLHEVRLGANEADSRPLHESLTHVPVPELDPLQLGRLGGPDLVGAMIGLCGEGARRWTCPADEAAVIDLRQQIDALDDIDDVAVAFEAR